MMKKITALFMTALMVLSMMTANVFAADDGKITVYDTTKGAQYSIYKIFDLEYTNNNEVKDSYVYTMEATAAETPSWYNFVKETTDVNGNQYVTVEDCNEEEHAHVSPGSLSESNAAEFAVKAKKYADDNNISATGTLTAGGTKVVFDGLEHGYYLILSTASTAAVCMLGNTDTEAVIKDKNYAPLISKWAKENGEWAKANDAFVGEVLDFKIEVIAEESPEAYTITDSMDSGLLELVQQSVEVSIYRNDVLVYTLANDGTYYKLITDADGFEIIFLESGLDLLQTDDVIRVEYQAFLNPTDMLGYSAGGGHYNTATLMYGNNKTTSDTTKTYTYELPLYKYAINEEDGTKMPLDNARFVISNTTELDYKDQYMLLRKTDGDAIEYWANSGQYNVEEYSIDWVKDEDDATVFISDARGKINIVGLDSGTYHFYEVEAPDGYSKLSGSVVATILNLTANNTGTINYGTELNDGKLYVMIENKKGIALPETGGIGTTIFYAAGGVLVIGAATLLIAKKRSENK